MGFRSSIWLTILILLLIGFSTDASAEDSDARLMLVVGDYALPSGEILVVGRSLTQLIYVNPGDGHQGPLSWRSGLDFDGRASFRDTTVRFTATFEQSAEGTPLSAVTWRDVRNGTEVRAERVHLFDIEPVTFHNGEIPLTGSVLLPASGNSTHPGIVLVSGSGAQSRYAQRGRLWLLADYLARQGLAVLVYDKRGIGGSGGHWQDPGLENDALAALRTLRDHAKVDSTRVGLWGISQGGWIVGEVAARAPREVAFVIAAGGGGINGETQDIYRTQAQMRADGFPEDEIRQAARLQVLKWRYARTRLGWDEYIEAVRAAEGKAWLDDPYIGPPTEPSSDAWDFWGRMLTPGTGYGDPTYWERVQCPVRVEIGELDASSPPYDTVVNISRMLQRGGNLQGNFHIVPGASHPLYEAKTGGPHDPIEYTRFAPGYLEALSGWLGTVTGLAH